MRDEIGRGHYCSPDAERLNAVLVAQPNAERGLRRRNTAPGAHLDIGRHDLFGFVGFGQDPFLADESQVRRAPFAHAAVVHREYPVVVLDILDARGHLAETAGEPVRHHGRGFRRAVFEGSRFSRPQELGRLGVVAAAAVDLVVVRRAGRRPSEHDHVHEQSVGRLDLFGGRGRADDCAGRAFQHRAGGDAVGGRHAHEELVALTGEVRIDTAAQRGVKGKRERAEPDLALLAKEPVKDVGHAVVVRVERGGDHPHNQVIQGGLVGRERDLEIARRLVQHAGRVRNGRRIPNTVEGAHRAFPDLPAAGNRCVEHIEEHCFWPANKPARGRLVKFFKHTGPHVLVLYAAAGVGGARGDHRANEVDIRSRTGLRRVWCHVDFRRRGRIAGDARNGFKFFERQLAVTVQVERVENIA